MLWRFILHLVQQDESQGQWHTSKKQAVGLRLESSVNFEKWLGLQIEAAKEIVQGDADFGFGMGPVRDWNPILLYFYDEDGGEINTKGEDVDIESLEWDGTFDSFNKMLGLYPTATLAVAYVSMCCAYSQDDMDEGRGETVFHELPVWPME